MRNPPPTHPPNSFSFPTSPILRPWHMTIYVDSGQSSARCWSKLQFRQTKSPFDDNQFPLSLTHTHGSRQRNTFFSVATPKLLTRFLPLPIISNWTHPDMVAFTIKLKLSPPKSNTVASQSDWNPRVALVAAPKHGSRVIQRPSSVLDKKSNVSAHSRFCCVSLTAASPN